MNKLEAYANIESGKMKIVHKDRFVNAISGLKDGRYLLTLERKYNKRSNAQNRYLWGIVYFLAKQGFNDIGYDLTTEQVHDFFKDAFCKIELASEVTGEVRTFTSSTANLKTTEFMVYLSKIQQFCAEELHIEIPDPESQTMLNFDHETNT